MATPRPNVPSPARIVRDPRVCGGEPTVEGTRIPVRCVAVEYQLSRDIAAVRRAYPQLDFPTIEAALAYYEAHRAEIDRLIDENERGASGAD